jgi:hypothetical protein
MSATATDEAAVEARLQALRQRLGKKQHFEEAVNELAAAVRDRYAGASPTLRKSVTQTPTSPALSRLLHGEILVAFHGIWVAGTARLAIQKPKFDADGTVGRRSTAWTWICFDCNC